MATDTINKFNNFVDELGNAEHDLGGADVLKFALTNTLPTAADANWNLTSHPAPAAANGYTAGGNTISKTYTETGGVGTLALSADSVFTATAGGIGPFQYVVLYNSSSTTPTNAGIGWYDYGSSITLADTETFTISAGTILTIT